MIGTAGKHYVVVVEAKPKQRIICGERHDEIDSESSISIQVKGVSAGPMRVSG